MLQHKPIPQEGSNTSKTRTAPNNNPEWTQVERNRQSTFPPVGPFRHRGGTWSWFQLNNHPSRTLWGGSPMQPAQL